MKHLIKIGLVDVIERCGVYIVLSIDLCKVLNFFGLGYTTVTFIVRVTFN